MTATWDLASFFPSFAGPEMRTYRRDLDRDVAALQGRSATLGALDEAGIPRWEEVLLALEQLSSRCGHLRTYVGCLGAAHADREEYARETASLATLGAALRKVDIDLVEALKGVSDAAFARLLARERVAPVAHHVRRMRERARHSMDPAQERLTADLAVDGPQAWGRLYDRLTGTMTFEMPWPDKPRERLPMAQWRSLLSSPDRAVGEAAFRAGNEVWERNADVFAAALNALAGSRHTLVRYRGHDHFLEPALFQASIRRETLDAMYAALRANAEVAREIVRERSRAAGRAGLRFYEREAPLPGLEARPLSWEEGTRLVDRAFGRVYPALRDYFRSVLADRWVEAEARPGKRPGAFCTHSSVTNEERVYMTYAGRLDDVRTLAHEVGHGWHARLLRDARPYARSYPMTLAETASTFAEQILAEGVVGDASLPETTRRAMRDTESSAAAIMLLDITVRFEFERRFYEERAQGELSASRLKELMTTTQREVYGDALEPGGEDPMFWASKLHFFIADVSFYNFPYTFGFLLTRALHARLAEEGPSFLRRYEDFLRATGSDTVENVVRATLGEDTTDAAFWARSIATLERPTASV
jgi:oligoendopeptidase F